MPAFAYGSHLINIVSIVVYFVDISSIVFLKRRQAMTIKEAKQALLSQCPVVYRGTPYKCVSAIVYRNVKGKIEAQVEPTDARNNNSLLYTEPHYVEEVKQ